MSCSEIKERLDSVKERIRQAAQRTNRNPEEIKLLAVSKLVKVERIQEAVNAGVTILGENYVQEARGKIDRINGEVKWHFIGHLQRNKVKYALEMFDMIQSLDSLALAEEIQRQAEKKNRIASTLVQVILGGEETKSGIRPEGVAGFLKDLAPLNRIEVKGFMLIPPFFADPEKSRPFFQRLRRLRDEMRALTLPSRNSLDELSMGMSNDFEVAIEEGATIVRVGTAIFGPRTKRD